MFNYHLHFFDLKKESKAALTIVYVNTHDYNNCSCRKVMPFVVKIFMIPLSKDCYTLRHTA